MWIRRWNKLRKALYLSSVCALTVVAAPGESKPHTPACTIIANTARIDYSLGGTVFVKEASVTAQVAQVLDAKVVSKDTVVDVVPGQESAQSTFVLINTGNGPDTFQLAVNEVVEGTSDTFAPSIREVWLDMNGNGVFDGATGDALYIAGENEPNLAAGAEIYVFCLSSIPPNVKTGDNGDIRLTATSTKRSQLAEVRGSVCPDEGTSPKIILGKTQASASGICRYSVASIRVTIDKRADVLPEYNTDTLIPGETITEPIPGAILTYTLTVKAAGTGMATNVVVTEHIADHTSYRPGNFTLDTAVLGEKAEDGDPGNLSDRRIMVSVPSMTNGDVHTITFNVAID